MIIGVSGFGGTGASAVMDILREFECVSATEHLEFQLLQQTDGILDLRHQLVNRRGRITTCFAISRFERSSKGVQTRKLNNRTNGKLKELSDAFIANLDSVSWDGASSYAPSDIRRFASTNIGDFFYRAIGKMMSVVGVKKNFAPKYKMRMALMSEEAFDSKARDYLYGVFKALGLDVSKTLVLEQLFSATNPLEGLDLFEDAKSIIVERDPRDVYITTNYFVPEKCDFMPCKKDPRLFAKYYRMMYESSIRAKDNENVLYISFEDLIFNYERSIERLEEFTGMKHNPDKKRQFDPASSINNTRMFEKVPEAASDIVVIEEELGDLLFDFDLYNLSDYEIKPIAFFDAD